MTLRCFVAMAFGNEDTDKFYDDLIVPVLKNMDAKPIRVDRIEHNDDIDDRIISELERCDFALADLTYARPSAYFEAGFAQGRKVPVIYTCRKDHLLPKADDKFGNFRVHFDLQMKNIIPWSSSSDSKFTKKLAKRITRVITPLLRDKETKEIERQESEKFSDLSLHEKTMAILNICVLQIERAGYQGTYAEYKNLSQQFPLSPPPGIFSYDSHYHRDFLREQFHRIQSLRPGWLGIKFQKDTLRAVFVHVTSNLTKSLLSALQSDLLRHPVYNINQGLKAKTFRRLEEHMFVCSFQKVPISRVMTSLRHFQLDRESNKFIWVGKQTVPKAEIPGYNEVYLIDSLSSEARFLLRNLKRSPSDRPEVEYWSEGNRLIGLGTNQKGMVKKISRTVHIHILDAIKFENAFEKDFSELLNRVESGFI